MCSSSTVVVYGLVIKTWTLLVAAHAFPKIQPILLALDMILLRKRAGTLKMKATVENKTNFSDLPEEVLEIIRKKVFWTLNMRDIARVLADGIFTCGEACPHCGKDRENDSHTEIEKDDWTMLNIAWDCDQCGEIMNEYMYSRGIEIRIKKSKLLLAYGLELSTSSIYTGDDDADLDQTYSAISIAIPSNSISTEANHESFRSSSTVLRFNPSTFDTAAADRRLIQFVKDFGLKLSEEDIQKMADGNKKSSKDSDSWEGEMEQAGEEEEEKEEGKVQLQKIEPTWMAINSIAICD